MKAIFYLLLILLFAVACAGDKSSNSPPTGNNTIITTGAIKGKAYLHNQTDHSNIQIKIGDLFKTTTNVDGSYELDNITEGLYTVTIAKNNYVSVIHDVITINSNTYEMPDIYLMPSDTSIIGVRKKLPVSEGIKTVWNFDDPQNRLAASIGPAVLQYRDPKKSGWGPSLTRFAKASEFNLPLISDKDSYVMEFPKTDKDQGYTIIPNSLPNGVFAWDGYVSNYTIIMDILWPQEGSNNYRSFYQTDVFNIDDADMFTQNIPNGGIGVGGIYHGSLTPGAWHRVAVAVQCALGPGGTGQLHKFIDGQFVGGIITTIGEEKRCRWALGQTFHLFTDNDGETGKGYVSSIMYIDRFMSMDEIRALGGPNASGANIAGPSPSAWPMFAKRRVSIIAHRTHSGQSPENTLVGIRQAFEKGANHVEVDVRTSLDGKLVLMHDETVSRTTNGIGLINNMSLSMLKTLDAGSWFSPLYSGEQVPTLAEALSVAKNKGKLLLDIKSFKVETIAMAIEEAGVTQDAIWVSMGTFSDTVLSDFKKLLPAVGILWGEVVPSPFTKEDFDKLKGKGVGGFEVDYFFVTKEFIDAAHANSMPVFVYTVMDPDTMLNLIEMGVDGIETDFPAVLDRLMP